jgi:phage N-6-adenine-methyltransferase
VFVPTKSRKPKRSDNWGTPKELFDHYNTIHRFDIDACAAHWNHLCGKYFTKDNSALVHRWFGSAWCNPPYSNIAPFVRKAWEESRLGATVVLLLPSWTDQRWFQDYCLRGRITFLQKRVRYVGPKNNPIFPSMVVTFEPTQTTNVQWHAMRLISPGTEDLAAKLFVAEQAQRRAEEEVLELLGRVKALRAR